MLWLLGNVVLHKKIIYLSDKGNFRTSIQCFGETSSRICHPSKLSIPQKDINHLERIQRTATQWVKGLRGLTDEERVQALKSQLLGKRRLRNDLVLTHKILYNHIDLDATQLFKLSRRPGLRRSSIRLLHQTGRARRRGNSFACRVVNNWNRILFSPQYGLCWVLCLLPISKYIHTYKNIILLINQQPC